MTYIGINEHLIEDYTVSVCTRIDLHHLYGLCGIESVTKLRAVQFVIYILAMYQYVLRKHHIKIYIMHTGVYMYT